MCVESWTNSDANLKLANRMNVENHFIKSIVPNGQDTVRHVSCEDNEADGFTRPLNTVKFEKF